MYGKDYALNFFRDCQIKRRNYSKKADKKKLEENINAQLESHSKLREQIMAIYKKNNNKKTALKFKNVKESVLYYTSPPYVIEAVNRILAGTTTNHKGIRKSQLYNPQDDWETSADVEEKERMEREYKREDTKKQRLIESVNDIIKATKVK